MHGSFSRWPHLLARRRRRGGARGPLRVGALARAATGADPRARRRALLRGRDPDRARRRRRSPRALAPLAAATSCSPLLVAAALCAALAAVTHAAGGSEWRLSRRASTVIADPCRDPVRRLRAGGRGPELPAAWDSFRGAGYHPVGQDPAQRLTTLSSARYELFSVELDSFGQRPGSGTGAGTFEFTWNRNGRTSEFVRDGHSLFLETMAELGWPGLCCSSPSWPRASRSRCSPGGAPDASSEDRRARRPDRGVRGLRPARVGRLDVGVDRGRGARPRGIAIAAVPLGGLARRPAWRPRCERSPRSRRWARRCSCCRCSPRPGWCATARRASGPAT